MIWKRLKKSNRESERKFKEGLEEEKLTPKDKFAMLISAMLWIVLPCLLVLVGFGLLILWIFGAL